MYKNKVFKGKILLIFLLSSLFLLTSSLSYAAETKEVLNHISISDTDVIDIESKIQNIWKEFEQKSTQRGMLIKYNYQPFVPKVNRVIILDTPAGELAYNNYCLRVETEIIDGKDARITELTLSKTSDTKFPGAEVEQQIGYVDGKLGNNASYWTVRKTIIPEELKALEQLKLENFEKAIELDYTGDTDYRKVPVEDVFHFFPEISGDLKLNFGYLYPQNDKPMFKTTYEPGRLLFGSLLDTDVRISFLHNTITGKMVHGEISWKINFGEFTTGEEIGMCESYFYFMQEHLGKAGLIAPAAIAPF